MDIDVNTTAGIVINHLAGKFFVWNGTDIFTLRTKHRICGQLVGSLPWKPWQTNAHSAPLILLPSEAHFCFKNGIAKIVDGKEYFRKRVISADDVAEFKTKRLKIETDQIKIFKAEKREKERLYYGMVKKRRRKRRDVVESSTMDFCCETNEFSHDRGSQDDSMEEESTAESEPASKLDPKSESKPDSELESKLDSELESKLDSELESKLDSELESKLDSELDSKLDSDLLCSILPPVDSETSGDFPHDDNSNKHVDIQWNDITLSEDDFKYYNRSIRIHIPTNSVERNYFEDFTMNYPLSERERCCCIVYEDMHRRGFYVTSAVKFGGDFLVYLGDPLRHHSHYIVLVLERGYTLNVKEIITYGRLAAAVKKTVVLATLNEDFSSVDYLSLK